MMEEEERNEVGLNLGSSHSSLVSVNREEEEEEDEELQRAQEMALLIASNPKLTRQQLEHVLSQSSRNSKNSNQQKQYVEDARHKKQQTSSSSSSSSHSFPAPQWMHSLPNLLPHPPSSSSTTAPPAAAAPSVPTPNAGAPSTTTTTGTSGNSSGQKASFLAHFGMEAQLSQPRAASQTKLVSTLAGNLQKKLSTSRTVSPRSPNTNQNTNTTGTNLNNATKTKPVPVAESTSQKTVSSVMTRDTNHPNISTTTTTTTTSPMAGSLDQDVASMTPVLPTPKQTTTDPTATPTMGDERAHQTHSSVSPTHEGGGEGVMLPESAAAVSKGVSLSPPQRMAPTRSSAPPTMTTTTTTTTNPSVKPVPPMLSATLSTDSDAEEVILSAPVWKRRSGLGKLSVKNAWERRKIVLKGSRLVYYKSPDDEPETPEEYTLSSSPSSTASLPPQQTQMHASSGMIKDPPGLGNSTVGGTSSKKSTNKGWLWEQAALNLQTARENLTHQFEKNMPSSTTTCGELDKGARGSLDLTKENATVAATTGHSGAPSPFAISIKVGSETKWKLCFDSHSQQMEWLAAMTDVIVKNSVQTYNAALTSSSFDDMMAATSATFLGTAARTVGVATSHMPVVALPPPPTVPPPVLQLGQAVTHGVAENVQLLWRTEPYQIQSSRSLFCIEDDDESDDEEKDCSDIDDDDDNVESMSKSTITSRKEESWMLRGQNLLYIAVLVNVCLMQARASVTTIERFWMIVTLLNLAMWLLVVKEETPKFSLTGSSNSSSKRVIVEKEGGAKKEKSDTSAPKKHKTKHAKKVQFKPMAGTSAIQLKETTDAPVNTENNVRFTGWKSASGSLLSVRSHGYLSTKQKIPSPGELYECIQFDLFESPHRVPDVSSRVQLPKVHFDDHVDGEEKRWHSPDLFVVSLSLPTEAPKLGRPEADGCCTTVTMYFRMTQKTRDILRHISSPDYNPANDKYVMDDVQKNVVNAVKLFEEWCRRAPTDPKFQARFKFIPNATNMVEIGMPSWIMKYNGKPVLIKRNLQTGFLYRHAETNCMEFDISLHAFPYLAKQALAYMHEHFFHKLIGTFGFVIEGRAEDELPEVVIGLAQVCYPNPSDAVQSHDFFSPTSPKSFTLDDDDGDTTTQTTTVTTKPSALAS